MLLFFKTVLIILQNSAKFGLRCSSPLNHMISPLLTADNAYFCNINFNGLFLSFSFLFFFFFLQEDDIHFKEGGQAVFSIDWKVELGEDKLFTFQDPEDKQHSYEDLYMSVTTTQVHMVEINDYRAFMMQNPNTKIAVWPVPESSSWILSIKTKLEKDLDYERHVDLTVRPPIVLCLPVHYWCVGKN